MMGPQTSSFPATKPALSCDRSMCTIARQISSKQLCIPRLIYASSPASGIICITKRASPDLDKVPSASFALQVQKLPASWNPVLWNCCHFFPHIFATSVTTVHKWSSGIKLLANCLYSRLNMLLVLRGAILFNSLMQNKSTWIFFSFKRFPHRMIALPSKTDLVGTMVASLGVDRQPIWCIFAFLNISRLKCLFKRVDEKLFPNIWMKGKYCNYGDKLWIRFKPCLWHCACTNS